MTSLDSLNASLCWKCRYVLENYEDTFNKASSENLILATSESPYETASQGCHLCVLIADGFNGYSALRAERQANCIANPRGLRNQFRYHSPFPKSGGDDENFYKPDSNDFSLISANGYGGIAHLKLVPISEIESRMNQEDVAATTKSSSSWKIALKWLETCDKYHKICHATDSMRNALPGRLIDVGVDAEDILRLCENSNLALNTKYTTLSHCWGQSMPLRLLQGNLMSLLEEIPQSELPRTFQDAIMITRRMKIRYIWIDSLCIVQDSKEDWVNESILMSQVYSNSYCNIAATAAHDSSGGLFFPRNPFIVKPLKVWMGSAQQSYYCIQKYTFRKAIIESPLLNRAWVHQERLLSPRTLHFGASQLFWECRETCACETFPSGIPPDPTSDEAIQFSAPVVLPPSAYLPLSRRSTDTVEREYQKWQTILRMYTSASLTNEEDVLPAIGGVALEMQSILNDEYLAGLWRRNLPNGLIWARSGERTSQHGVPYKAPSWSWASVNAPVGHFSVFELPVSVGARTEINVIDAKVRLSTRNPFGEVSDGYIRLEGKLARATLRLDGKLSVSFLLDECHIKCGNSFLDEQPRDGGEGWDQEVYENLHYLPIIYNRNRAFALILKRVEGTAATYRRLGLYFSRDYREAEILKHACHYFDCRADEWGEKYRESDERGNLYTITII